MTWLWFVLAIIAGGSAGASAMHRLTMRTLFEMCAMHEDTCAARHCGQWLHCGCVRPPEYVIKLRWRSRA
jgi:hypothetical protein